jgi:hypothetical protein
MVREEHFRDEITTAACAGPVEDGLEVLLDGVFRDHQLLAICEVEPPCEISRIVSARAQ